MEIHDRSSTKGVTLPLSVIILTYNEEKNIRDCLESVKDWASEIWVVDSYSTDSTLTIVRQYTDKICQHPFENYACQRNWALQNLPIASEWILNLDADHRTTPEFRQELAERFTRGVSDETKGFLASRRTMFMGRWIKHGGHYPVYHAVMFRKGWGCCEDRLYDQHFVIQGKVETLSGDIIDIVSDSLTKFIERHNKWATLEAMEQLSHQAKATDRIVQAKFFGHEIERRRFWRSSYGKCPLFVRSFLYFVYRYFFKLGFLDGTEGLIFHMLQGFWYRFLIDAKMYEMGKQKTI
jgi:glycosyltransferase involved in cell wall biosynthesis